jgi:hypothetical protein
MRLNRLQIPYYGIPSIQNNAKTRMKKMENPKKVTVAFSRASRFGGNRDMLQATKQIIESVPVTSIETSRKGRKWGPSMSRGMRIFKTPPF